ncbi:MAG: type II toxin-antitoxin system RelE/ParE family toxin [Burkholderiales bacterium]|nr:type II toxin-antitoxin system RelE/ParE family toxin [Burkholderiales bacterium]
MAEQDLDAADRWLDRFDAVLQTWAGQPLMGRPRPKLATDLRSFAFEHHAVFYLLLPKGLAVVRVLHASRRPLVRRPCPERLKLPAQAASCFQR